MQRGAGCRLKLGGSQADKCHWSVFRLIIPSLKGKQNETRRVKKSFSCCVLISESENLRESFPSLSELEKEGNLGLNPQVMTNRQGSR